MNFYKNYLKYINKSLKLNEQVGGCELLTIPLEQLVKINIQMFINSESIHKYNVIITDGKIKECWNEKNAGYSTYTFNGKKTLYSKLSIYVHPSVIEAYTLKKREDDKIRLEILKKNAISKKGLTFDEKEILVNSKSYNPEDFKSVIRSSNNMYDKQNIEEWFLIQ